MSFQGLRGLIDELEAFDKRNKQVLPPKIARWRERWVKIIEKERNLLFMSYGVDSWESLKHRVDIDQRLLNDLENPKYRSKSGAWICQ